MEYTQAFDEVAIVCDGDLTAAGVMSQVHDSFQRQRVGQDVPEQSTWLTFVEFMLLMLFTGDCLCVCVCFFIL